MDMKFVTAKDLRTQASSIWNDLPREQEVVITLNGKPVAIMTATTDKDFEHSLRAIRRARAMEAVMSLQQSSVQSGRDAISEKEIDAEIKKTRSSRK
jgi:antitoxin (DNA-binding transcriptional repressor) of toxin-antitoxin stability system